MGGGCVRIRIGHLILTVGGVAYLFTLIWTSSRGHTQEWKLSAAAGIIVRRTAESLPGSTFSLWLVAVAVVIACYVLARSQFGRMEVRIEQGMK
jgi:ribose/xylose/arabinose/galactoside ABC-type transport system permease subunit